jgi:hypothetical protein
MRLIDRATGQPPVLRNGYSFSIETMLIEGTEVPDGVVGEDVATAQSLRTSTYFTSYRAPGG